MLSNHSFYNPAIIRKNGQAIRLIHTSMEIADFIRIWPCLFHMTAASNLAAILTYRKLFTAHRLLRGASRSALVQLRRDEEVIVELSSFSVVIRSQQPLDPTCLELDGGWTLSRYVQALNSRVFFWPGTETGPVEDGARMVERQKGMGAAILRVPTLSLFRLNRHLPPSFSPHNTGAAWCEEGGKSRRGDNSFLLCDQFEGSGVSVAEVSFEGTIELPPDTLVALSLNGPYLELVPNAPNREEVIELIEELRSRTAP